MKERREGKRRESQGAHESRRKTRALFFFITCISIFNNSTSTLISHSITYPFHHDTAGKTNHTKMREKKNAMAPLLRVQAC